MLQKRISSGVGRGKGEVEGCRVQGFKVERCEGGEGEVEGCRVQGFEGSRVREFKGSGVQEFKSSRVRRGRGDFRFEISERVRLLIRLRRITLIVRFLTVAELSGAAQTVRSLAIPALIARSLTVAVLSERSRCTYVGRVTVA